MDSKLSILFFTISLVIFYQTATCIQRTKRDMTVVLKELNQIKEDLTNVSNSGQPQWQIGFNHFTLEADHAVPLGVFDTPTKQRAGLRRPPPNRIIPYNPMHRTNRPETEALPGRYNAADAYGRRCPSFRHIATQGGCSNCWAVASISMIDDRVCMYTKQGQRERFFSARYLTTCLEQGCDGGWFDRALQYWITTGLVDGGDYRMYQPRGCVRYPSDTSQMKYASCPTRCDNGTYIGQVQKSYGGAQYEIKKPSYLEPSDPEYKNHVEEIMREIYLYGPVIATYDVYNDLAHYYRRGVYRHTGNVRKLGGHATKLYGWGVENGVPFWYAANSWGSNWGDGGLFKIQRGTNECNIERKIHAAVPLEGLRSGSSRAWRRVNVMKGKKRI